MAKYSQFDHKPDFLTTSVMRRCANKGQAYPPELADTPALDAAHLAKESTTGLSQQMIPMKLAH